MKSYRSSLTFITVELLFIELLPFVKNGFPDFSFFCMKIYRLNLEHQTKNTSTPHEQLQTVAVLYENVRRNNGCRSEFVGAGGDLYC